MRERVRRCRGLVATMLLGATVGVVLACSSAQVSRPAMSARGASFRRRVALVIGNARYQNVATLANPESDARAVAAALRRIGFEVQTRLNLGEGELRGTLRRWVSEIRGGDLAMLYYSGHGASVGGNNYLLPVDFELGDGDGFDARLAEHGLPLEQLLDEVESREAVNVLVFDACRHNPWGERARARASRSIASGRGAGRGLAVVQAPAGSLVMFSTSPGTEAADGEGNHSPFTEVLLRYVEQPEPMQLLTTSMVADVRRATGGRQTPWFHSSLQVPLVLATNSATLERDEALPSVTPVAAAAVAPPRAEPATPVCSGGRSWNPIASACACPPTAPNWSNAEGRCVGACMAGATWNDGSSACTCDPSTPEYDTARGRCVARPCPAGMALIPAGEFMMGSPEGQGDPDEHPQHRVRVGAFCMDRTEVTVASWRECVIARVCTEPGTVERDREVWLEAYNWNQSGRDRYPVNGVNWDQANTYCRWRGGRLPSEAEWEFAARGTSGRTYPWGDAEPTPARANLCGIECEAWVRTHVPNYRSGELRTFVPSGWSDPFPLTAPVGSFPEGGTPEGLLDMVGNVWEWTADWHTGRYLMDANTARPRGGLDFCRDTRVTRGGMGSLARVTAAHRSCAGPSAQLFYIGVRCAQTP